MIMTVGDPRALYSVRMALGWILYGSSGKSGLVDHIIAGLESIVE